MSDRDDGLRRLARELAELVAELAAGVPGPIARGAPRTGEQAGGVTWARAVGGVGATDRPAVAVRQAAAKAAAPSAHEVTAPIFGTFHGAAGPGVPPFVKVGERVEKDQQIGVVEAMRLTAPVLSPWPGEVAAVVAADGESVEFGQVLVLIRAHQVEGA
ncbi:biotin/lipoyl-containing protein [Streptomyces sp. NPDC001034]|uniref:acetyl-CoA carboxylase biotin carboxyl carrier protein n=1 Tax=Streptomyces sp. NPDC001034 TaxID=3154375 RepID=UPI00332DDF9D